MSSQTACLTTVKSWVLVVYLEEDVLSHPLPLEEIEDLSGQNGVEADLRERQLCLARYYVGDGMHRAVIVKRSENQEELMNFYNEVMKLEKDEQTKNRNKNLWHYTKVIGGSVVVGGLAVAAAPLALSAAGFSSGGIVAGSLAARLMSMAAIANGGGVAAASAGGWIAALQSAGAAGISATTNAVIGTTAGGLFGLFSGRKKSSRGNGESKEGNGETKDIRNTVRCARKTSELDMDRQTSDHRTANNNSAQTTDPGDPRHSEDQQEFSLRPNQNSSRSAVNILEEELNSDFQSLSFNEDAKNLYRENLRLQEENQCKICMDCEMNTLFEPCGHLCACQQCASQLRKCPICNQKVKKLHRVYKS
ncbi:uncharacterized protein LOC133193487 [Saccostrea echinata]|uniref:uncharacterized protein LOC133193487 n=1 Tax=Saccostrea echinata TaxID=191078 RepID=UPI002A810EC6|nr:uncharacterized protein LOC133193487 [Saccostrea echinata]